jgi:ABC-2 type transport system permease protein
VTALFDLAGVDYRQWKAVSRTLLRTDFRVPLAQSGESYSLRTVRGLLLMAAVHGLIGLVSAFVVVVNSDAVLTATIVLSYLTFVLATAILTQHGATMLSATDYQILGPRPVSSRTFLAIRLTNILFYSGLTTTFVAIPPIVAFTVAHGPSLARGVAAAAAIYAWAVALTLGLAAGYGALLRFVGATRLQRALAYMQLVVGMLMYGGILLSSRSLGSALQTARMPDEPWPWAIPPAWFAGYLTIATGGASAATWARAALSVTAIFALLLALRGRIGLDYASRLAELPTSQGRSAPTPRTPLFAAGEQRAVALLVLAHFRHDLRVRMGVLGVLPLLLFYMILGGDSPASDPFVAPPPGTLDFIALAVLLFPAVLTQQFASSESYQASWIYSVTHADRAQLVIALKNLAVVYFLLPFLVLVAALYSWRSGEVSHALAHTAMLGLVSHVALQSAVLLHPNMPFSRPPEKISGTAGLFVWMMFVIIGGQALIWLLPRVVYVSWTRIGVVGAALAVLTLLLNRAIRWRVGPTPN